MRGPYTAKLRISQSQVGRFYSSGGCDVRFERASCFAAAALLEPGESAEVELWGWEGSAPKKSASLHKLNRVRREESGACFMTLGSRFGERLFRGL